MEWQHLLKLKTVNPTDEDSVHASEAVGELVEALIGCRFEETHQGHDEAVRARIMQVLVGCLEGGAGTWLPDEVVWEVLQTCMANLDQMVSVVASLYPFCCCGVFPPLIEKPLASSGRRHVEEAGAMEKNAIYRSCEHLSMLTWFPDFSELAIPCGESHSLH